MSCFGAAQSPSLNFSKYSDATRHLLCPGKRHRLRKSIWEGKAQTTFQSLLLPRSSNSIYKGTPLSVSYRLKNGSITVMYKCPVKTSPFWHLGTESIEQENVDPPRPTNMPRSSSKRGTFEILAIATVCLGSPSSRFRNILDAHCLLVLRPAFNLPIECVVSHKSGPRPNRSQFL